MAVPVAYARSSARVARICEAAADARTLRLQLVEEIRQVVGFYAYAWLLTDPGTSVGSAPLADVPCLPELPRLIRLKYVTDVNRWTAMTGSPAASLHDATEGDPTRSLLWRELLCRYDIQDVASLVHRDRFGCWGFLDLWRSQQLPPFTEVEIDYLADIAAPVTTALRRCQANTFAATSAGDAGRIGPVVLLLSPDLQVLRQTPEAQEYLRALVPPTEGQAPIPASAYNVAAQLLAVEQGIDDNPPSARVHVSGGRWVNLRAARIGDAASAGDREIAVTIEETSPAERADVFASAFGFSTRERELLGHLMTGTDTRQVAGLMFLSEHTVQDHLKSIFAKTATHNRPALLARALGT
ncbi:transcriptional regulator [Aeromicrobium sp. Root344]|uniref:helix-turn-helix transcriptional regulator n=1 Tax=Aeromicrobium sp. Root344 TaxID=1736521 RepID=UPI0007008D6E|nr:helix-turn-helix domain-containing protein [Aeromicrobium sp. Root344]KQV74548.1 transcriptional regulator [Aeromicrobium sp. Root344]